MKPLLPALLLGVGLSTATVTPAVAYPVDCAILLCLAGGWPASAECAHARTVFIGRITPWPIEPPLQIWNCPMRVSLRGERPPLDWLYDITFRAGQPPQATSIAEALVAPILVDAQSDVDISDTAFDFVRSIRVFRTEFRQHRNSAGDCSLRTLFRTGTYGRQGQFRWSSGEETSVPPDSELRPPIGCQDYTFRSVFVDWTDVEGTYGYEEVRY